MRHIGRTLTPKATWLSGPKQNTVHRQCGDTRLSKIISSNKDNLYRWDISTEPSGLVGHKIDPKIPYLISPGKIILSNKDNGGRMRSNTHSAYIYLSNDALSFSNRVADVIPDLTRIPPAECNEYGEKPRSCVWDAYSCQKFSTCNTICVCYFRLMTQHLIILLKIPKTFLWCIISDKEICNKIGNNQGTVSIEPTST